MEGILGVQQGATLPFCFALGGRSIDDYTCLIEVKEFPGDTASVSRTITPTDGVWEGFLTEAETAALAVSDRRLTAKKTNTVTGEIEKETLRFHISLKWI